MWPGQRSWARSGYRRNRFGGRSRRYGGRARAFSAGLDEARSGELALGLSSATPENWSLLWAPGNLRPTRSVTTANVTGVGAVPGRGRGTWIQKLVLRLVVVVGSGLAEAMCKYWFGIRIVELEDDMTVEAFDATSPGQASLYMENSADQKTPWLLRNSMGFQLNATAANLKVIGAASDSGDNTIIRHVSIRASLQDTQGIVFQHKWATVGAPTAAGPDAVLTAYVESDLRFRPRA